LDCKKFIKLTLGNSSQQSYGEPLGDNFAKQRKPQPKSAKTQLAKVGHNRKFSNQLEINRKSIENQPKISQNPSKSAQNQPEMN
jgi:hypothetical protein